MLLTAVAQRAVAESDAATKVAFYSVVNQVADAQRQFALDAWRVCRRYVVPLDDEVWSLWMMKFDPSMPFWLP